MGKGAELGSGGIVYIVRLYNQYLGMGLVVLRVLHEGDTSARKRYAINYITDVCMCSEERKIILLVS